MSNPHYSVHAHKIKTSNINPKIRSFYTRTSVNPTSTCNVSRNYRFKNISPSYMSCHKNESSRTFILFYEVCNLSLNSPPSKDRSLQHSEENYFSWDSCQSQFMELNLHKCGQMSDISVFLILSLCAFMLLRWTEWAYEHTDAWGLILNIMFNSVVVRG